MHGWERSRYICARIGEEGMRRGFSRMLSGLLAFSLLFSSGSIPVKAGRIESSATVSVTGTDAATAAVTGSAAELRLGTMEAAPSIEVQLTAGVEVNSKQSFQVTLSGEGTKQEKKVTLGEADKDSLTPSRSSVVFDEGLKAGRSYTVEVSGSGYITYKQEITDIKNNLHYRVQIYTGKVEIDGVGEIVRGDINEDGKLDEKDATPVIDAIEAGKEDSDSAYDLNGDGKVNLLDLHYLTDFFGSYEQKTAQVEVLVSNKLIIPKVSEKTVVLGGIGKIESMLEGKGTVSLQPESGNEISEADPVQLELDFTQAKNNVEMKGIVVKPSESGRGVIAEGTVEVEYGEGMRMSIPITSSNGATLTGAVGRSGGSAVVGNDGTLVIDLGGQIAVKHVTLKITKTTGTKTNLAEISSVEFVNDMEKRIPDPVMNIPTGLNAAAGNKSFTLSWKQESNVTAYEIEISCEGKTETRRTNHTKILLSSFNKDEMENNKTYTVRVQSLNGEWKSGYSSPVSATPKPVKKPDAPDNVAVRGEYRAITVSWAKLEDADSFTVFYKEDGALEFKKIENIKGLAQQITGLKDNTKYIAYVTARNDLGEGAASLQAAGKTLGELDDVELPKYKLVNTSNGKGVLSKHIKAASIGGIGFMVDSPLDTGNSALGLFDNSYQSYVECVDWDYGGAYPDAVKGVTVELDKEYTLGMVALYEPIDIGTYTYASVSYWDGNNVKQRLQNISIVQRSSSNRRYYFIKFNEPVKTSKLQIGIGRYGSTPRMIRISELRLYEYDSIENDIMGLYADDLHIELKSGVTADTLKTLQGRLDTKDSVSGEYHPDREALQKELDMAKQLLETPGLNDVVQVNPNISAANDSGISVGGLNAWQPLGVAAGSGEQLVVYVGNPKLKAGASAKLQLVFAQQHAEVQSFYKAIDLKVGRNEVTLPVIASTDKEKGGALYVQYTGNNSSDQYAVRVSGGVKFPVLRLYRVSGEERAQRISAYIKELTDYTAQLKARHTELHSGSQNENLNYAYDEKNCIFNMTDIQADKMMISIPASQALAGLGTGSREANLAASIQAMDEMLTLFYQHKGLTDSFAAGTTDAIIKKNHLPYRYQNIRYMKMFAGAFMYAAGNHIGVEWGSTTGVVGSTPVVSDEKGKYISGRYFGWGIAHEIGHEINQGAYTLAEVTNNYFSVLAQAKDNNSTVRFQYPEVFKKVTSGTWGYSENVFTQLGMYWQLHLAYDRDYNYKTYDTYQEIFNHLFFARVDSYARDTSRAPGKVALTLSDDRDQNLMRLASAAAERDLTEFFTRWGLVADSSTKAYMAQFEKEERAIYYVDDTARVYEMENGNGAAITGKKVATATAAENNGKVTLKMTSSADSSVLQGYEITRVFIEQGKERREIAGFTQSNTFTDNAAFAANHVITYEVTAIDKLMNRSAVCQTSAVKIQGDGLQDKTGWTVSTNMTSSDDKEDAATEQDPCEPIPRPAIERVIDGNTATVFQGSVSGKEPYILLELNRYMQVTALKYTASGSQPITNYKIEISLDGEKYTEVKKGTFTGGSNTVYFENGSDPWVCTYDAAFVKLTAVGQSGKTISAAELDLYGPSGDNVEISSIGVLESEYVYDTAQKKSIPAKSVVFTGSYKGNPAYNVVVLYDKNGTIVGGTNANGELTAHQIILAPDPKDAKLGDVSEGTWIYWIEPSGDSQPSLPAEVRAELYRVDNALTNEGQRLVSDTEYKTVPKTLPSVSINQ